MDSKNGYSELYHKLRNQIETTWPQWKIDAANEFICSKNSKPLIKRDKMKCYRKGGCGPYEMYSCQECPASKREYLLRNFPAMLTTSNGFLLGIGPVEKPIVISYETPTVQISDVDEYEIKIRTTITKEQLLNILEELY